MKLKHMKVSIVPDSLKYDEETGIFTCYGNVKGNIDHAKDRTMDGAYQKSIDAHAANGTMPKMLWNHDPMSLPVGKWLEWKEDAKGLWLKGKVSDTSMGKDLKILAKDRAVDAFSIGYFEIEAKWNHDLKCNDLHELDIKEVSWVNFACNEASQLESIKSGLASDTLPTKRELQKLLRDELGLSKSQAEKIVNKYQPDVDDSGVTDVELEALASTMSLFSQ